MNLGLVWVQFYCSSNQGVQQDDKKAYQLVDKAAQFGSNEAVVKLGKFLREGRGINADAVKAVKCFEVAEERNYAPGIVELGFMYERGKGITLFDFV